MPNDQTTELDPKVIIDALNQVQCETRERGFQIVARELGYSYSKVRALGQRGNDEYQRPAMPGVKPKPKKARKKVETELYVRECNHPGLFGGDPLRQMISTRPWTKEGLNFEI